jgi:hypothetical protein
LLGKEQEDNSAKENEREKYKENKVLGQLNQKTQEHKARY